MTKTEIVRNYIANNPDVDKRHLHQIMLDLHPEIFGTPKKAWSIVQTVFNSKTIPPGTEKPQNGVALSERQLRELYDIRSIVMRELSELREGEFWRDGDFTRKFQGKAGYRSVLESAEASAYKGKASGQVFWGHPKSIQKMKCDGVLI